MKSTNKELEDWTLVLAAEECDAETFQRIHKFSNSDETLIRKLSAHGPVLLQGGRGTGKSALMREVSRRLSPEKLEEIPAVAFYVSLRHLPLLKSSGGAYEALFANWVSQRIQEQLTNTTFDFEIVSETSSLKKELATLAQHASKRVILLFDDAAHIGRETSLETFFDIFRTLASDTISCKAAIYPGVTEFGTRFDVYNDATVLDVVKNCEQADFDEHFVAVLETRYPNLLSRTTKNLSTSRIARFLGRTVLGNHRSFIFACNALFEHPSIGLTSLGRVLVTLASSYYWPLLEEVKPKLGKYTPAGSAAAELAEKLIEVCAPSKASSVIVHRAFVAQYSKPFEILEYTGLISRREGSRAMKSGGRGPRFELNLCCLLECVTPTRLTRELFDSWSSTDSNVYEVHKRSDHFLEVEVPTPDTDRELQILSLPIRKLRKSKVYPYGLTPHRIKMLRLAGFETIGKLAEASDETIRGVKSIGKAHLNRIRSAVAQAVWM